ncbi:hypothetical protein QBC38DRAFT_483200 [Podospora fimiseda]|uniref:Uncharacterized protein n=1 Tax=Podospora fimiseda TaxID=252190 RepID=A0AAN7BL35_9PEZI|nr:hypothetical protein QBC38DRAFT_483200 [Podospora fimiseda]
MPRLYYFRRSKKRQSKQPPKSKPPKHSSSFSPTCIVNAYPSQASCDQPVPSSSPQKTCPPLCLSHLCQRDYFPSTKRCLSSPLRIVNGKFNMDGYGLYPDLKASWNCSKHERYNCVAVLTQTGGDRCPGQTIGGWPWCGVHLGMLCRSQGGCTNFAGVGSLVCEWHRWYVIIYFLIFG